MDILLNLVSPGIGMIDSKLIFVKAFATVLFWYFPVLPYIPCDDQILGNNISSQNDYP
jgi:hypothetical protein